MKKQLVYWLMSQRHSIDRGLKKKLMIGAAVVGGFILIGGIIATYIGIKATSYLVSKAPTQEQISVLATDIKNHGQAVISGTVQKDCLSELQAHMNLSIWISKPINESAARISKACFNQQSTNEPETTKGAENDQNNI